MPPAIVLACLCQRVTRAEGSNLFTLHEVIDSIDLLHDRPAVGHFLIAARIMFIEAGSYEFRAQLLALSGG
jgi:hypothetical protein